MQFAIVLDLAASTADADDAKYKITRDVVYGHKAGMALTFDVIQPAKPNGAGVMFMMSGGWFSMWVPPESFFQPEASARGMVISDLVEHGYTVFVVRHGSAPQFKVPEAVADVRRAARFVRLNAEKYGIDPERIGVCGGSAGGHLSLMLGTTGDDGNPKDEDQILRASSEVAAVVAYYAPVDLRDWAGPDAPSRPKNLDLPALDFDPKLAPDVSPLLHVTDDDAPTLLVHGDEDDLVKLDNSERIHEALQQKNVPCELLVIEGAGHSFPGMMGERATDALINWFDKHLAADEVGNGANTEAKEASAR